MNKPSLPKGTRDFGPVQMHRRKFILDTIERVFSKYGFQPLETPAIENLSVLTGKYGEEGDKLLFKILNSGDFLKKSTPEDYQSGSVTLAGKISEKGLRYDLTVPFARYVVMNQNDITFPFKRYQIQPVWRADRPQKGRYREFYQCDADVVGTDSLICEADIVMMIDEVFSGLGIKDYSIKINHRQLLTAMAEKIESIEKANDLFVALDKLDKIGVEGVKEEMLERGFTEKSVNTLEPFLNFKGGNSEALALLEKELGHLPEGNKGIDDIKELMKFLESYKHQSKNLKLDITLARGLSYYTGIIFETTVNNVKIGSVSGGGRYDNLTGVFGMHGLSGVGFSFGVDRLYDVLEELELFPDEASVSTLVLAVHFSKENQLYALNICGQLRDRGVKTEIYPDNQKLKKQLTYANKKDIPYVMIVGDDEMKSGKITLKEMKTGSEENLSVQEIIQKFT